MKNQYFGDINDYRKYGLLRAIQSSTDLRLAIGWMLTPDNGSTGGRFISYLSQPEEWERYDPQLFRALCSLLSSQDARGVAQIESAGLIPRASFFSERIPDDLAGRANWLAGFLRLAADSELAFLDPDNGLEVRSKPIGQLGSSKYLYWQEVESLWQAGLSLLIYQHFPRKEREEFVARLSDELRNRTRAPLVAAITTAHVVFLLAAQEGHRTQLANALGFLEQKWAGQLRRHKPGPRPAASEMDSAPVPQTRRSESRIATMPAKSTGNPKQQIVRSGADLDRLEAKLTGSATAAVRALESVMNSASPLEVLALLKFTPAGRDPLDPERPLNVVEQLNQTFTYLASIEAARWLLERYPDSAPLTLNLGTSPGSDIESRDGGFAAEVFAATHPDSNNKLRKDIAKVEKSPAAHRFVFFLSPVEARQTDTPEVRVVRLDHPILEVLSSMDELLTP